MKDSSVVVGILHPPEWCGSAERFAAEVAEIEAVDSRIETVVVTYVEPHELRTARGAPEGVGDDTPEPPTLSDDELAALARIDVALAIDIPPAITSIAPDLRWVQSVGSGTAHLQAAGLEAAGVTLTSNGGANSIGIAEFVFGRLLESAKNFPAIAAAQAEHRWEALYGNQVSGQTIGLIGFGAINQAVAARASAFGMRVLAVRRSPDADSGPHVDRVFAQSDLHEMLDECDAVVAAVPETPETVGMMDADAFAAMRRGAFFANVGRGTLLDEAALIAALESGQVGAAALDVTHVEPLPVDDPLWGAPNLRISGHCSTAPAALLPNLYRVFRENLGRFVRDEALENVVSSGRGY